MAAPTNAAYVKKVLANPEPSTHGTRQRSLHREMLLGGGLNRSLQHFIFEGKDGV
jgi:hypothetical protein